MRGVVGIDAPSRQHAFAFKLNLLAEEAGGAAIALASLLELCARFELDLPGEPGQQQRSALIGFSARFFDGVLDPVENVRRGRWTLPRTPACLRTMRARGDEAFAAVATLSALAEAESDLMLIAECDERDALDALAAMLTSPDAPDLRVTSLTRAFVGPESRDPLGYPHGISNLQDLRVSESSRYRRYVFVHGEEEFAGDTYLAYRKYRLDLERWSRLSEGERAMIVGRSPHSGRVVDAAGVELDDEPDSGEGGWAPERSHIRQAHPRDRGRTQFGSSVRTRDVRLLRRSFSFHSKDGGPCDGLLFLAFQADIQQRGFEFINNEWLMARGFLGGRDALLAPEAGLVEVLDGCYYWVPVANSVATVIDWLRAGSRRVGSSR